ncbi:MAG: DNA-binding transcriptional regulator Fis [Pseudomonadota bacterium]|nr:DNA-binding transcriptional regulator Fis [Pseudomonadota bacterium]
MTAETLANENNSSRSANDEVHQLQTVSTSGDAVTLRDSVEVALTNYLAQLDGAPVSDVYQLVLSEVEAPLLEQVMKYTRNNQTKASAMLGLNRGTLRKKLKQYGLL